MTRTEAGILDMLRRGGILPVYWRRKRATAKWHRGFRAGPLVVHSQCGKIAGADMARLLIAPIDEPWPAPRCTSCERATPGTDAVRDYVRDGLDISGAPLRRSHARRVLVSVRTTSNSARRAP